MASQFFVVSCVNIPKSWVAVREAVGNAVPGARRSTGHKPLRLTRGAVGTVPAFLPRHPAFDGTASDRAGPTLPVVFPRPWRAA